MSLTHAPLPHAEHRLLRNGMTGWRASMVICPRWCASWAMRYPKNPATSGRKPLMRPSLSSDTSRLRSTRPGFVSRAFLACAGVTVNLSSCSGIFRSARVVCLQPLSATSRERYACARPRRRHHGLFSSGSLGPPGLRRQTIEKVLVNAVVGVKSRKQGIG